jgi:hypothetical protein
MKVLRIFLLVLIVIGLGLLLSQKLWVPGLVAFIIEKEQAPQILAGSSALENVHSLKAPAHITLGVGEKGKVGTLEITFNSLVQDYRCPVDMECMEGGAVTANVTFAQGTHSETKNMPSDEIPQSFDGYQISIAGVAPPLKSKKQIPPKAYRITFHVSK